MIDTVVIMLMSDSSTLLQVNRETILGVFNIGLNILKHGGKDGDLKGFWEIMAYPVTHTDKDPIKSNLVLAMENLTKLTFEHDQAKSKVHS